MSEARSADPDRRPTKSAYRQLHSQTRGTGWAYVEIVARHIERQRSHGVRVPDPLDMSRLVTDAAGFAEPVAPRKLRRRLAGVASRAAPALPPLNWEAIGDTQMMEYALEHVGALADGSGVPDGRDVAAYAVLLRWALTAALVEAHLPDGERVRAVTAPLQPKWTAAGIGGAGVSAVVQATGRRGGSDTMAKRLGASRTCRIWVTDRYVAITSTEMRTSAVPVYRFFDRIPRGEVERVEKVSPRLTLMAQMRIVFSDGSKAAFTVNRPSTVQLLDRALSTS